MLQRYTHMGFLMFTETGHFTYSELVIMSWELLARKRNFLI
jgi:hypothetical protein